MAANINNRGSYQRNRRGPYATVFRDIEDTKKLLKLMSLLNQTELSIAHYEGILIDNEITPFEAQEIKDIIHTKETIATFLRNAIQVEATKED